MGCTFPIHIKSVCGDLMKSAAEWDLEHLRNSPNTDKEEQLNSSQDSLFSLSDQEWDFKRKGSTD
jgi:hypothetical protein